MTMIRLRSSLFALVVALAALVLQIQAKNISLAQTQRIHQDDKEDDLENHGRIIGGMKTTTLKFPWQVYIGPWYLKKEVGHYKRVPGRCGGSIINKDWILSAAHCVTDIDNHFIYRITVYAGIDHKPVNEDGKIFDIYKREFYDHVFIFPYYQQFTHGNNDIALIKLKTSLLENDRVKPITRVTENDVYNKNKLITSGYGLNPKDIGDLEYVTDLHQMDLQKCAKDYFDGIGSRRYISSITDSMICQDTKMKGFCTGDSGGPLVTGTAQSKTPVQIGIISKGRCDTNKVPDVFINVAKYNKWIELTMNGQCKNIKDSSCTKYPVEKGSCFTGGNSGLCKKVVRESAGTLLCTYIDQFIPDLDNCNKYYVCVHDGFGSFTKQSMPCPDGLYFNPDIEECDWPAYVPACPY